MVLASPVWLYFSGLSTNTFGGDYVTQEFSTLSKEFALGQFCCEAVISEDEEYLINVAEVRRSVGRVYKDIINEYLNEV